LKECSEKELFGITPKDYYIICKLANVPPEAGDCKAHAKFNYHFEINQEVEARIGTKWYYATLTAILKDGEYTVHLHEFEIGQAVDAKRKRDWHPAVITSKCKDKDKDGNGMYRYKVRFTADGKEKTRYPYMIRSREAHVEETVGTTNIRISLAQWLWDAKNELDKRFPPVDQ